MRLPRPDRSELAMTCGVSLRGARFLAYARNRLRNLVVGLGRAGGFILGAEASSADIDFLLAPFYHNRSSMNIREPFSIGTSFGMTYTVPKLSSFTANLALHGNFSILLNHPRKSCAFRGDPVNFKISSMITQLSTQVKG